MSDLERIKQINIVAKQGDWFPFTFEPRYTDGELKYLVGATAEVIITDPSLCGGEVLKFPDTGQELRVLDGTTGSKKGIELEATGAQTATWPVGTYQYVCKVTYPASGIITEFSGSFKIEKDTLA